MILLAQDVVSTQFAQMPTETVLLGFDPGLDSSNLDMSLYLEELLTFQALFDKVLAATTSIDVLGQEAFSDDFRAVLKLKAAEGIKVRVLGIKDPNFESKFIQIFSGIVIFIFIPLYAAAVLVGIYGLDWMIVIPVTIILLREVMVSGLRVTP